MRDGKQERNPKRRSAFKIMLRLIGLVKPLVHIMLAAIVLGVLGYLCAIFLTIAAGQILLIGLGINAETGILSWQVSSICILLVAMAVARGILHYAEQYCNHFIAFKLLAIIRHEVFTALRRLCPAKLEGKEKGNLISIITTDIELLEVFYAHTISPIVIAAVTSIIMVIFIGQYHIGAGLLALCAYGLVGVVIPVWNGKRGSGIGMQFRSDFGELNSFVLDSLRGLDETIQYGQGEKRKIQMSERSIRLGKMQQSLSRMEGSQRSVTNLVILLASFGMLGLTVWMYMNGKTDFSGVLTCTIAMMGSFGPVVALSSLSNNLNQTLASGERVLSILEEEPIVEEIPGASNLEFEGADASHVTFAYDEETILEDYSVSLEKGKMIGIHGSSGSGKSTLLKLLMRFWEVDSGKIEVSEQNINTIPTAHLRNMESYVTQETHLFHDSIANNIAIAKPGAAREEIEAAAKKASVHDFIQTLPKGYDTSVGELGDTLSGGEKQRIGIARSFLHDAPLMLLDEPTSNLDSLNEGMILKALEEACKDKTVVLVSHRKSTLQAMDVVYEMDSGRIS